MSYRDLLAQTVTVLTVDEAGEDEFGNRVPGWPGPGVTYPARLTQVSGDEVTIGRDAQVSEWKLYLEADAVIGGRDRVVDGDRVFEVVGPPLLARTPRGVHHVEARLRYIEG